MKPLEPRDSGRRAAAVAVVLALLPAAASAQSPGELRESAVTDRVLDQYRDLLAQETLAFTIAQAVDVASELHPDVRLNRERLAEFPILVREARAPYLPQLDLNLQFAQTRDPGFRNSPFFSRLIDDPGASPFGGGAGDFGGAFTFGTYLWNFQASQVVWSFGLRPTLRGIDVGRAIAEADLEEVQNRVARDTVTRLHSYLLGLRTRDVLQQAVATSERGLELARDRLELGAGARLDVLRARVQLSRLRRQLSDAEDVLAVERAGINALVGREQAKAIEVLDALELPDPLPRVLPAEALMELAVERRPELRRYAGMTLGEVAEERGATPAETAIDLVVEDGSRVQVVYFLMSEENVAKGIALPWVSFASDAASMAPEGEFLDRMTHPRAYGNFARVLGKYVRDEQVITLEDAVRKLTKLPATNLGIRDRGELREGFHADIAIFDPDEVQDHATYDDPHRYSTGMVHVLVNGVPVLRNGEHTGALPGQVVRGPGWAGWNQ